MQSDANCTWGRIHAGGYLLDGKTIVVLKLNQRPRVFGKFLQADFQSSQSRRSLVLILNQPLCDLIEDHLGENLLLATLGAIKVDDP
jgi:hypothetical protein